MEVIDRMARDLTELKVQNARIETQLCSILKENYGRRISKLENDIGPLKETRKWAISAVASAITALAGMVWLQITKPTPDQPPPVHREKPVIEERKGPPVVM